jgi:hypothetical protein
VLHAQALHGNPYDGYTLGPVITELEALTGVETRRIHVDKGYRGHSHPHKFRVWISGQVRRVTAAIRREMKRRAAVEPVIGHVKAEHRMDRNYLKGRDGDCINAVLAAAGYNFGLLLRWLAELCAPSSSCSAVHPYQSQPSKSRSTRVLHGRLFNLSRLAAWWIRLGIAIERGKRPQQNGRHERMRLLEPTRLAVQICRSRTPR